MISSGINLVMTVIGFAVSILFIVFVCTRLVCARIHMNASRRSFPIASRSDLSILERGLHGLDPVVIASFPTKKFSDAFFASSEDAQCTACLEEYRGDDVLRILPYCGHSFHVSCIDIWLQQHSTCPICRMSLRVGPADKKRPIQQPTFSSAVRSRDGSDSLGPPDCRCPIPDRSQVVKCDDHNGGDGIVGVGGFSPKDSGHKHIESPSNP